MDPNNDQPSAASPIPQPVSQPAAPVQSPPPTPVSEAGSVSSEASAPKKGMGKGIILLIILLLLVLGIGGYILFAKSQMNNTQKTATDNTSSVLPSPTPTLVPTLAPEEDLEVSSPEADLINIEADVKGL